MPNQYLALDVGSTTVSAIIIDLDSSSIVGSSSTANTAALNPAAKPARSEWDLNAMSELAIKNAAALIERTRAKPSAIGVTGQQQGLQLLNDELDSVGPYISWQDQRSKEKIPSEQRTYLDEMGELGGAISTGGASPAFANTGCPLGAGYTAPLLFWLKKNNQLPKGVYGTTTPEFVVARLTNNLPVTDPTDAMGWGVYNVTTLDWDFELIDTLGLSRTLFPPLVSSCTVAGYLGDQMAQKLGVSSGIPIAVASGDHQCSFAGTVIDYCGSVAVNVGTGGQSSVYVENPMPHGSLELRPHIDSGYLLAGVGIVGGRTFRTLRDFFSTVVSELTGTQPDPDSIYEQLVDLAQNIPAGSDGVKVDPLFTGSPKNPLARGAFLELTPKNCTPGHLARALFEAMANRLANSYREALSLGAEKRTRLVGSGNGIKLNPVLRESLMAEFGMPIELRRQGEEAALGAALCAAVADGAFESMPKASASFLRGLSLQDALT